MKSEGINEEILLAEYEAVYRYVLYLCKEETEAKDITQETFLKAFQSADHFKGSSSLLTWLCSIAKNLFYNKCRKKGREVMLDESGHKAEADKASLEELLMEKDISMRIYQIVHIMDEPYKEVFSLRVFGELSFAHIAQLFSKTESWARVTYHRARKAIIEQCKKEGMLDE